MELHIYSLPYSELQNGCHVVKDEREMLTFERNFLREICELKIFLHLAQSLLLYKRFMEPENGGHTHTHEVSTVITHRAHACRVLMTLHG